MLLFISDGYWKIRMTYEFQYISCYSLSERSFRPGKCYHVSIHLMLLFIIKASNEFVKMAKFQYISCYSLSTFWTYMNTLEQRFNTSHVTLYLTAATGQKITVVFQYISYYSLSAKNWAMDHLECEFQYISCYSLSYQNSETELVKFCFNTSHVTLYPKCTELIGN